MGVTALIGGASAFVESTLAQVYKEQDGEQYRGGPAYYIAKALGKRWLGVVFSLLLIACFIFGFNPLQAYNVSSAVSFSYTHLDTSMEIRHLRQRQWQNDKRWHQAQRW